jgi:CO/xanthine dehydrogenase Mo-binding subunit
LSAYREKRVQFERANRKQTQKRNGMGLSVFFHGSGFTGSGEVRLASELSMRLTKEGGVEVLAANVEYGQGTNTVFAQIAAEACKVSDDLIRVHQPDTAAVPNSGPTVASRTTMIVGKLVERAGLELRRRLNEPVDFKEAAEQYVAQHGGLTVTVRYEPPTDVQWDDVNYRGEAYAAYAWGCDVAEVEVDMTDFSPRVTNFVSTVECGRVLNPALAAAQIEGGIAQGIGFALYEHVILERGAMKNNQFTNYIIPTSADTPDIHVEFVEFPYANPGPYAAKGIGEMPIDGPAPAIASGVADALGGRFINEVPILPERIMHNVESP